MELAKVTSSGKIYITNASQRKELCQMFKRTCRGKQKKPVSKRKMMLLRISKN